MKEKAGVQEPVKRICSFLSLLPESSVLKPLGEMGRIVVAQIRRWGHPDEEEAPTREGGDQGKVWVSVE